MIFSLRVDRHQDHRVGSTVLSGSRVSEPITNISYVIAGLDGDSHAGAHIRRHQPLEVRLDRNLAVRSKWRKPTTK